MEHIPVLEQAVVAALLPALEHGGVFVDATLGRAGHARAVLAAAEGIELVGIDRDPEALEAARSDLAAHSGRTRLLRADFKDLAAVLERLRIPSVRAVLLDLGVSSPQLDAPSRGFSYRAPGPLDMRMDPSQRLSAHDVVNGYSVLELERVLRRFGEERFARRISRAIERWRPIEDTQRLAEIVRDAIPAATRRSGGNPARRTFQALRIEVNGELDALTQVLPAATRSLESGGRIAVLSYHSLEDRIVKRFFDESARGCVCPPDFPVCVCDAHAELRLRTRRAGKPTDAEIEHNPRARAARLRVAQKLEVAA